ncbi:DUF5953 family protein [Pyxidicoccus sp. 3LFB2]
MRLNPVKLDFVVPPLASDDASVSEVLRVLEDIFPGVDVSWCVEPVEEREPATNRSAQEEPQYQQVRVVDRDGWVTERLRSGTSLQLFSAPGKYSLNVSANPGLRATAADGREMEVVTVWLSRFEVLSDGRLERLVARCGDALRAWHMGFMPVATTSTLLPVLFSADVPLPSFMNPRVRFPALNALPRLGNRPDLLPGPQTPLQLGWLNYWSLETARWLGFPNATRDGEWLGRSTCTDSGAWVVTLTDTPLELERHEHVDTLVRAYTRFDQVGVRGT